MKIAVVCGRYVAFGGAEHVVSQFINYLILQGHEVHLFAAEWTEALGRGDSGRLIFHRVPILRFGAFFRLVSFMLFSRLMIKRQLFDSIISFERTLYQDVYRAGGGCHREWLKQRQVSGYKKLTIWINPFHLATLAIEKHIYVHTPMIIANSHRVKEEIIRHYKTPSNRIKVIQNGVDLQRFHPSNRKHRAGIRSSLKLTEQTLLMLFVGSGFERKGLDLLIEAAARMHRSGCGEFLVLVVGKGDPSAYTRRARRLGLPHQIRFMGVMHKGTHPDNTFYPIEYLYAAADLFVLPTRYDPFANVCLEAMASGTPVVTTQTNGASELLTEALSMLVWRDQSNVGALTDILCKLMDAHLRTWLGELSRKAAENYSHQQQFGQLTTMLSPPYSSTHYSA